MKQSEFTSLGVGDVVYVPDYPEESTVIEISAGKVFVQHDEDRGTDNMTYFTEATAETVELVSRAKSAKSSKKDAEPPEPPEPPAPEPPTTPTVVNPMLSALAPKGSAKAK